MFTEEIQIYDLVGKPFREGARGPDFFDCYGLVIEIANRREFQLPDFGTPADIETRIAILEKVSSEYAEVIDRSEPYANVVFKPGTYSESIHVGVVLKDCRRFIHAGGLSPNMLKKSVRIEELNSWPWSKRIFGFFRLIKCLKK